ncbi:MAG: hypothetical protein R3B74_04965 [Nitrospirales bacterium]|nr:hypothetical protein [Nitrospirales bacterium]
MIRFDHVFKEFSRGAFSVVALRDVCLEILKASFVRSWDQVAAGKVTRDKNLVAGRIRRHPRNCRGRPVDENLWRSGMDAMADRCRNGVSSLSLAPGLTIEEIAVPPQHGFEGERGSDIRGSGSRC